VILRQLHQATRHDLVCRIELGKKPQVAAILRGQRVAGSSSNVAMVVTAWRQESKLPADQIPTIETEIKRAEGRMFMNDISRRKMLAATAAGAFTVGAASAQSDGPVPQPQ